MIRDCESEETPPAVRAQAARAWKEIECLKRVMRGLPANTSQSIKSEPKQRKARVSGPVEPIEVIEPVPVKLPVKPTINPPETIESAGLPVSQPESQPAKSTGAWAKAMGEPEPLG